MSTTRAPYRTREDCTNLIRRLTAPDYPPVAMLAGGKSLLQAAVCEDAYYISADACGIPEKDAHAVLQSLADTSAAPTTPRDYRGAWSRLLAQHFAEAPESGGAHAETNRLARLQHPRLPRVQRQGRQVR